MRKPEFRVHYNVTLLNFIDTLSRWDYFVTEHVGNYFGKYYGINAQDRSQLEKYSEVRQELGWPREMELFDWAYRDFPENKEFLPLTTTLHYFEQRTDKNGMTLKAELEHATEQLEAVRKEIEVCFQELKIHNLVSQFKDLFESPDHEGSLPCYLTYSPSRENSLGGANGDGIYTQVSIELDRDIQVRQAAAVIAHEYLHKELNPGRYFKNHPERDRRKIYNTSYPKFYPDSYYQFVEEVIVYTLNDVITFGVDPVKKKDHYNTRYKDDQEQRQHSVALWQSVSDVGEILESYRSTKLTAEEAIAELDLYFIGLVR